MIHIIKTSVMSMLLLASYTMMAEGNLGTLTNNGSVAVNVVMYNNYIPSTEKYSARGRLNAQGIIIPPGQNITFLPNTTSIDVYYGNGNLPGVHAAVSNNYSYTISPGVNAWVITQDQ